MIHTAGTKDNMIANNLTPFVSTHPGEVITPSSTKCSTANVLSPLSMPS